VTDTPSLPAWPVVELGVSTLAAWFAFFAPKGTPKPNIGKLNESLWMPWRRLRYGHGSPILDWSFSRARSRRPSRSFPARRARLRQHRPRRRYASADFRMAAEEPRGTELHLRKRGKSRGVGMIIRFSRRRESDSLRACRCPRILMLCRLPN
jgi:hypothetical protein